MVTVQIMTAVAQAFVIEGAALVPGYGYWVDLFL